jgi:hypothetical protein
VPFGFADNRRRPFVPQSGIRAQGEQSMGDREGGSETLTTLPFIGIVALILVRGVTSDERFRIKEYFYEVPESYDGKGFHLLVAARDSIGDDGIFIA